MESKILKLNYWLFSWYYKRVPKHFHSWTFFKSVKLLISNYTHLESMYEGEKELHHKVWKENDRLRDELSNIRMGQIATDKNITDLNNIFGTSFTKPTDN